MVSQPIRRTGCIGAGLCILILASLRCEPIPSGIPDTDYTPGWTSARVRSRLFQKTTELAAYAQEDQTFDSRFLKRLARRYASVMGGLNTDQWPTGCSYVRNLDGRPIAFTAVFSIAAGGSLNTAAAPTNPLATESVEALGSQLNAHTQAFLDRLNKVGNSEPAVLLARLQMPENYYTVLLGASPASPVLLSARKGLPPQAFMELSRSLVARHCGLAASAVQTVRPFCEPRMPKGYQYGILCRVKAETAIPGATITTRPSLPTSRMATAATTYQQYVYVVPSNAHSSGVVLAETEYRTLMQRAQQAAIQDGATDITTTDPPETYANDWANVAVRMGYRDPSEICTNRGPTYASMFEANLANYHTGILGATGSSSDDDCTCQKNYSDGSTVAVSSCDDRMDECCDPTDDACLNAKHLESCTCNCSSTYTLTGGYGRFLRGVPTFYQHTIGITFCSGFTDTETAVGCGPIAGAELVCWYDQQGYNALGDDYRGYQRLEWDELANTLRTSDYMDGDCVLFSGGGGIIQTSVSSGDFRDGLEAYFEDKGYTVSVDRHVIKQEDEISAYETIKDEIDARRPVAMLYCVDAGACEGSIGLTDLSLSDWSASHYGLICGYYEDYDGLKYIYVNNGGTGSNEAFQWHITEGKVRLITVQPGSADGTEQWCGADDLDAYYWPYDDITYTCRGYDYNVVEEITGDRCDMLEYPETYTGTTTWTSTYRCVTPDDLDKLMDSMEQNCEDHPYLPGCDDDPGAEPADELPEMPGDDEDPGQELR